MIKRIRNTITLTTAQVTYIAGLSNADKPRAWKNDKIGTEIKESATLQLDDIQDSKCCYCGLQLWETGRGEIDHIASKSGRKKSYPEFTFELKNIALACEHCNGSSKKGERDVVFKYNTVYDNCTFKIVHPYYDDPDSHYMYINNRTQIIIKHKTWKGRYSIILFGLELLTNARSKQVTYEKKVNRFKPIKTIYNRFLRIINFNK